MLIVEGLLNFYRIAELFVKKHWEWLSIIIVSLVGVVVGCLSYGSAKSSAKKASRERLFNSTLEYFRSRGELAPYLLGRWGSFKKQGWREEEFEEIYREVYRLQNNGKDPKNSLFENR